MTFVRVPDPGNSGVVKDLSQHELPINAWSDASNIRFLDGYLRPFYGHGEAYGTPLFVAQHLLPSINSGTRYWIYAGESKIGVTTITGGVASHTDISHVTPRTGVVNKWTSTTLSNIPILNAGDGKPPMYWDFNLANKFVDLPAWPSGCSCESLRTYKNYLVALNVTKSGSNKPTMVKWSHPADPGALPASWDETDPTKDAGESDLAEGGDRIIDGLQLRDSFVIYKEASVWRMDFTGGVFVFRFQKVLGVTGALNRNCIVEIDGLHLVLTSGDVVVHDGNQGSSILDKQARRSLLQDMDTDSRDKCFVFKNPFFNEVFVCYPSLGSSVCNKALVYNYVDKTVAYREMPNLNHANYGTVDDSLSGSWDSDQESWDSDLTLWAQGDFSPNLQKVLMATNDTKLYLLDSSTSFAGVPFTCYAERRGLSFDVPEKRKLIRSVRARIVGNTGQTVLIKIGSQTDPWAEPVYVTMTHTIGSTISVNCLVDGRYISIRFEGGTATSWRLDSYDLDIEVMGDW